MSKHGSIQDVESREDGISVHTTALRGGRVRGIEGVGCERRGGEPCGGGFQGMCGRGAARHHGAIEIGLPEDASHSHSHLAAGVSEGGFKLFKLGEEDVVEAKRSGDLQACETQW